MTINNRRLKSRSNRSSWRVFVSCLIFSIVVLFPCTRLCAQVANGINGTVTDASVAVIAGANLTVTNNSTSVVSHALTSSAGTFTVVGLNPGHYSVAVEAKGFKRSIQTDVTVEVAKMSALSFEMTPGSISSSVRVEANAISLNTTSPVIGTTLEPELVKTAPIEINGMVRQIDAFMYLAPGVQGNAGAHYINGGVTYENEVQFNGVPVAFTQYAGNQTNINPPYEMVNEFRVNSSTFDARYGLGQGAVTYNMASGTNQLHGDAFEILRNQLFDSSGFFPTHFSSDGHPAPPVNQQNNYGFQVSGPVILPHLYNGKDRTFFLFSSDWFKQNQADNSIGTVPTAAMKQGDFSNFVDSTGALIPIYDPQTGQPFPGNKIPANRFSALANSILPSIPNPDRVGIVFGLQANKLPAVPSVSINQNVWGYTIDHTLTPLQSVHFSQWRNSLTSPFFTQAPIVPASNELQSEINNTQLGSGFLLNYVKTMSRNLVMTAGADWIGEISGQHNANMSVNCGGVTDGTTFPFVSFDGQNASTAWGVTNGGGLANVAPGFTDDNNRTLGIVLVNNWLWNVGRNSFNIGGQFRRIYQDIISCLSCGGGFSFSQRTTSTPNSNNPAFGSYGSSFASFLLGEADSGIRILSRELKLRNKAFAAYVQDDIKVNKRLTANVGLRWDIMVPFTEDHNDIIYVNPMAPDPGAGNLLGGATKCGNCTGCAGVNRAAIHWKYFQPRVGFSYALNPQTVLQGGFYLTMLDGGAYEYGTSQVASFMASLLEGQYLRTSNGSSVPSYGNWDTNPMPLPTPVPFSPSIGNGGVIFAFDPQESGVAPYDQAWNINIQRQLPWDMFLTVAYVGNRAIHLPASLRLSNQPNPSVLKYGSLLAELVTSPDAIAAGIKIPYPDFVQQFGGGATVEQALTPFPQYGGYYPAYEMDGTAFYNAFQMQAEKRFSSGFSYLADITLSRLMANTWTGSEPFSPNGINAYNPGPEYSPSYLDQKYVTNFVATYELPVGRDTDILIPKVC
ncbi:MAG: carboxypeptidase-like regulatory domain-containing protein [Acidobacteriaceae bacterium]